MKKVISVFALMLSLCLVFASCSVEKENADPTGETAVQRPVINIGLLKGPTGMGAAQLLEKNSAGESAAEYSLSLAGSPDVLVSSMLDGSLDVCALPTNTAAVLYGKTGGKIRLLAVNTLGVMYILSSDPAVTSLDGLKGKTIISAGQGTTTEYVLNYILESNGLTAGEDVTVEYASEHAEVLTKALSGDADTVLLPEPFVTQLKMKSDAFASEIDLTQEWEKLGGGALTMGCIAVSADFADANPDAVAAFMSDYGASVNFALENTADAAALIEKYEIATAEVAQRALPNCNITCLTGAEMKQSVFAYLDILFSFNPSSVGGAVPADDFYIVADEK